MQLLRRALLYQNNRNKGRAQTRMRDESHRNLVRLVTRRRTYLRIKRTSPARRLAERLALFFFRSATVVLYDCAMPVKVSPFLTLW